MNRRRFLAVLGGGAAAAAVGVPLVAGVRGASSTGVLLPSRRPLPAPFTRQLTVPAVLRPTRTDETTDYYTVTQRPGTAAFLPGVDTRIWGYEGTFPGPTIRSRSGRRTVVTHHNRLPVPVSVHLHGGHTPASQDGYPTDLLFPPGFAGDMSMAGAMTHGTRDYAYTMRQRAATLWYHDHRMDFTGPSVWRGLAGFHLVTDDEEQRLPLPSGERDIPLMIVDRSFDADGQLRYPSVDGSLLHTPGVTDPYGAGVLGDVVLVNGTPWPVAPVAAVRYRLRILNASNARRYRLALDPDGVLLQVGTDGGLLPAPVPHQAIEIAPAQRFDVVVDFSRYRAGQMATLVNEFGEGRTGEVMRFHITGPAPDDSSVPSTLSVDSGLSTADSVVTRTFHFRHGTVGGMAGWTVNGDPFDPTRDVARPRLGTTETWRLMSDFHHPIHVHLAHFRVLSRGIGAPGDYDHGWKDTVDLRPAEEATILVRFEDYPGRYLLHCHNLEHEDMAMMAAFSVA